jgi:hypothetical protein
LIDNADRHVKKEGSETIMRSSTPLIGLMFCKGSIVAVASDGTSYFIYSALQYYKSEQIQATFAAFTDCRTPTPFNVRRAQITVTDSSQ